MRIIYLFMCLIGLEQTACNRFVEDGQTMSEDSSLYEEEDTVRAAIYNIIYNFRIPEEHIPVYMDRFFELMDVDHNGLITKKEYLHWLLTFAAKFTPAANRLKFEQYDTDEDNYVVVEEYIHKALKDYKEIHSKNGVPYNEFVNEKLDKFIEADIDGDNRLTEKEFIASLYPFAHLKLEDESGLLTRDTLDYGTFGVDETLDRKGLSQRYFHRCDTNSDNSLDADESQCYQTYLHLMNMRSPESSNISSGEKFLAELTAMIPGVPAKGITGDKPEDELELNRLSVDENDSINSVLDTSILKENSLGDKMFFHEFLEFALQLVI